MVDVELLDRAFAKYEEAMSLAIAATRGLAKIRKARVTMANEAHDGPRGSKPIYPIGGWSGKGESFDDNSELRHADPRYMWLCVYSGCAPCALTSALDQPESDV